MKEFWDGFVYILKNRYADFNGRARRREYWGFILVGMLISIGLMFVDSILGTKNAYSGVLSGLFGLATFIPSIATLVRRLHDTDRSGWWILLLIVPLAGLVVIAFALMDGTQGDNKYGPNPKAIS